MLGKKGCGKSFWMKRQLRSVTGPLYVWDHRYEYGGPKATDMVGGKLAARPCFLTYLEQQQTQETRVELQAAFQAPGDQLPLFALWCTRLHGATIVIDEAHLWGSSPADPQLLELVRVHRHTNCRLYLLSQRPAGLDPSIRSQADRLVSFVTNEPGDLDWFRKTCSDEYAERVASLPQYRAAKWPQE